MSSFNRRLTQCFSVFLFLFLFVPTNSNGWELAVNVGDTSITRDADSVIVSVFMETVVDSVAGFSLWMHLNHDEIFRFRSDSVWVCDTTYANCADSNCIQYWGDSCIVWEYFNCADTTIECHWSNRGAIILDGTLVEDWDLITSHVLDENHMQLKIVGIANQGSGTPPIAPNTPNNLLVRLIADVREDKLDSLECADTTCIEWDEPPFDTCIFWQYSDCALGLIPDSICPGEPYEEFGVTDIVMFKNNSLFSDPKGQLIGWVWRDPFCVDSNCTQWEGDSCIAWECAVWDSNGYVDTNKVKLFDGAVSLDCTECDWIIGDADGSGAIDVDDVVYLIAYIFLAGPEPTPDITAGDANCGGSIDVDDAVYLITYIFLGGPPPPCTCNDLI